MAVTSTTTVTVLFTQAVAANLSYATLVSNTTSPGSVTLHTLTTGANTITLPTGGSTVVGALVLPPTGNTVLLKVKGVNGDTGIFLNKVNPTLLTFDTTQAATFIIDAASAVTGLRIIWS